MDQSERASDILKRFFEYNNLGSSGDMYVSFFRSWEKVVGVDLAAHTRVADIRNNAAIVEVDHPAWMQVLQMQQDRILKRIQQSFPELEIRAMHMRLVDRANWSATTPTLEKIKKDESRADVHLDAGKEPSPAGELPDDERLRRALLKLKNGIEERNGKRSS